MTPQSGVTEKPRSAAPSPTAATDGQTETTTSAENSIPRPLTRNERTRLATPMPQPAAPVLKSPVLRAPTKRSRAPRSATPPTTQLRSTSEQPTSDAVNDGAATGQQPSSSTLMAETTAIPASLATSQPATMTLATTRLGPVAPIARQDPAPTSEERVIQAPSPSAKGISAQGPAPGTLRLPSQSPPEVENSIFHAPKSHQQDLVRNSASSDELLPRQLQWDEFDDAGFVRPLRGRSLAITLFAGAVALIVLGVLFLPSPLQGRFRQSTDTVDSTGDTATAPLITRSPEDLAAPSNLVDEPLEPLAGIGDRSETDAEQPTNSLDIGESRDSAIVGPGTEAGPTTTQVDTTTTSVWEEPTIEPKEQWIATDSGVALPDILFKIRFCESTNNYESANGTSSARGAYQFLTKSWDWYGHAELYGVPSANLATPAQQDQAALKTYDQSGARPWAESRACWDNPDIDPRYRTAKPQATPTTTAPPESSTSVTESSTSEAPTTTEAVSTTEAPTTTTAPTTTVSTTETSSSTSSETTVAQQDSTSSTPAG